MNDSNIDLQILQALQTLKGDFHRLEENTTRLGSSVEGLQSSLTQTREEMIRYMTKLETEAGELQAIKKKVEEKMEIFQDRVDEMAIVIRDNTLWVNEEKQRREKQADRMADGVYGMGFDWVKTLVPWLVIASLVGWQVLQPKHVDRDERIDNIK